MAVRAGVSSRPAVPSRRALLAVLALTAAACGHAAPELKRNTKKLDADQGLVVGRLGLATRRPIRAERFELTAVAIPSGSRWQIDVSLARGGTSAPFLVHLPPGRYRLTKWAAISPDQVWGGEDLGVAIEVPAGAAACIGGLYLAPRERAGFKLGSQGPTPGSTAEVRDECQDLRGLLESRAPALGRSFEVRLAWRVQ